MMLVRLIIFIVLVSLLIVAYRKLTARSGSSEKAPDTTSMKKCELCGVHLPESEAIKHKSHYFCNLEHQKNYLDQNPDE